jgi:adenosylmethionine-8-amino-7-oxononanoate aminotransferase
MLETVVGTNGILVPPDGYLAGVRELCDRHGIVMICDEVMTAFGRCGEWFAIDHWGVTPDLICFAKGVNSGYVPSVAWSSTAASPTPSPSGRIPAASRTPGTFSAAPPPLPPSPP